MLENEIIPLFFRHEEQDYSKEWVKTIKNSIATIAPHYTMKRQLDDYFNKFYIKLANRFEQLDANNHQIAKDIAQWKESLVAHWDAIKVVSKDTTFLDNGGETGVRYQVKYIIDEQGLDDAIGLELVNLN